MPGKSRRGRGKRSPQGKKRGKSRQLSATATQQPAVAQTHEPVPRPVVSAPPASLPAPTAKPATVRYPYIATELRTIGILAGVMLIILVVLAFVLS